MLKKGVTPTIKGVVFSEIFLLVMASVAVSFILGGMQSVSAGALSNPGRTPLTQSNVKTGELMIQGQDGTFTGTKMYSKDFSYANGATTPPDTPPEGGGGGGGEGILGVVGGLIGKVYEGTAFGPKIGPLISAAAWGFTVYGLIKWVAPMLGASEQLTNALANSALAGIVVGKLAYDYILKEAITEGEYWLTAGESGLLIGVGVAVVVFLLTYKKEKKQIVELQCLPWEAPLGGADCERCNQDPLRPCSEYRCKALGQACDLVNKGSVEERCVWVARNDVSSPIITPWTEVLTLGHKYSDIRGRPPSLGTKITSTSRGDGCIKPFTPLKFGIRTNEPSQCKLDTVGNKTFDQMAYYFGESNFYRYNHTQQLRLPSPDSISVEAPELPQEGTYNFYVRCRDANGRFNEDEFVFNLCVDKSPDTTAPIIEGTSINSGSAVTFGVQNINLSIYANEPADCKWSIQDKDYGIMENSFSCSRHVYEQNARQQYPCTTTLTGLQDKIDNMFFFRCKDQPLKNESDRNVNQESYKFTLKGTQPLSILSVGPNGTFTGSSETVIVNLTVKTDDGAGEGKAICSFSPTGNEGSYVPMFSTDSYLHEQRLSLQGGSYTYFFRCLDAGGNADTDKTSFTVFVDRAAPQVTRVYRGGVDHVKLITNEPATCAYSITSCNFVFGEGIVMTSLDPKERTSHAAPWKPNEAYYIKCKDDRGNEPSPNACSAVVSASSLL